MEVAEVELAPEPGAEQARCPEGVRRCAEDRGYTDPEVE